MSRRSHRWSKFTPREDIPRWIDRRGMEWAKRHGLDPSWLDYRDYGRWQFTGPIMQAMALQNIGGVLYAPAYPAAVSSAPNFGTTVVDADAEGYGMVFKAPATGNITGAGTMTGTLTTGDASTLMQLESVSLAASPGVPNGIISANVSAAINVAASNTWYNGTFTSSYAATLGELMAVTINRQAAGALNTQFNMFADEASTTVGIYDFPYSIVKTGASWALGGNAPVWAINYGGTYYPIRGASPFSAAFTTTTFNNTSTPDVVGNIFIPKFKCRVVGIWLWADMDGAAAIKFYDTDGTTSLGQATYALNERGGTSAGLFFFPLDDATGPASISPTVNSTYRVGVEPSSGTSLSVYDFTVSAAAFMDAFDLGQNFYKTTAKNPAGTGDWTNTTTQRVFMGLIIDQLDDGVGGGGGGCIIGDEDKLAVGGSLGMLEWLRVRKNKLKKAA